MNNFKDYCTIKFLQINKGKTKILRFNSLIRDFVSPLPPYPSVSSAVIFGVTFSVDCLFSIHVDAITIKANCVVHSLILQLHFGFSMSQLKTAYLAYIRPVLEYVPCIRP